MTKSSVAAGSDSSSVQSPQTGYPEDTSPFGELAIVFGAIAVAFFVACSTKRRIRH